MTTLFAFLSKLHESNFAQKWLLLLYARRKSQLAAATLTGERELCGHTLKYRRCLSLWAERQFSSTAAAAAASGLPARTTAKWYSEKSWKELHTKGNRHSMSHPPTCTRTQTNTSTSTGTGTDREHARERVRKSEGVHSVATHPRFAFVIYRGTFSLLGELKIY